MSEEKKERMDAFEFNKPVIKGYPELRWTGKRPYTSTQFYPAQLKEKYGEPDENGWFNKIFWGDNLQVMSHLLKEYRGKISLIYIDPPFDSKADYKKTIKVRGKEVLNDNNVFEEKQYGDIWTNDEYLQFMYERLILLRELLSENGSIYLHCDWHKSHHLRCIMDDIFGPTNLRNEIAWCYTGPGSPGMRQFNRKHDTILWYSKSDDWIFNSDAIRVESTVHAGGFKGEMSTSVSDSYSEKGKIPEDWWEFAVASRFKVDDNLRIGYPTEKPFKLLDRIIETSSNPGDIILDVFMGGGTTPAEAFRLGRKFIAADINLGSVQLTTKRILNIYRENENSVSTETKKPGFEVYNVNNYDFFRNPVEAKDLLIEALNIQPFNASNIFDGELDGRHVKILPVNRIATKADLSELVSNLPYKMYEKTKEESPNDFVDHITLICMGHEPDLSGAFKQMIGTYKMDVEVLDILKDKADLEFKRDAQAEIRYKNNELKIIDFYPMNLLQKLSLQKEAVEEWRQLVDSVMIDYNYDGSTLNPQIIDIPEKNNLVKGKYDIPSKHGRIMVKITDLLSESIEVEAK